MHPLSFVKCNALQQPVQLVPQSLHQSRPSRINRPRTDAGFFRGLIDRLAIFHHTLQRLPRRCLKFFLHPLHRLSNQQLCVVEIPSRFGLLDGSQFLDHRCCRIFSRSRSPPSNLSISINRYHPQPTAKRLRCVISQLGKFLENLRQHVLSQIRSIVLLQPCLPCPVKNQRRVERHELLPSLFVHRIAAMLQSDQQTFGSRVHRGIEKPLGSRLSLASRPQKRLTKSKICAVRYEPSMV